MPVPDPLREQLEAGERLLWHGRPRGVPAAESVKWLGVCVLALLMIAPAAYALRAVAGAAWVQGQHYAAVGVACAGVAWIGLWLRAALSYNPLLIARTFYGVTDRRLIAVYGWPWRRAVTLELDRLASATVVEPSSGGSGTIEFGLEGWNMPRFSIRGAEEPEFYFIQDPKSVHALILCARDAARGRDAKA